MYWHLTKCRYCYTASNEQTLNQMSLNRTSLLPSKTLNKIHHRIMELNHRMIEQNVIEWYNETSSNEPTFDQMSSSLKWQNDSFSYFVFFISIPLFVPSLSLSLSLTQRMLRGLNLPISLILSRWPVISRVSSRRQPVWSSEWLRRVNQLRDIIGTG